MKLNRNKGNLQNELQKMLQAGRDNVENETQQSQKKAETTASLRTNAQSTDDTMRPDSHLANEALDRQTKNVKTKNIDKTNRLSQTKPITQRQDAEARGLNAAQRHEVPERNAKYAGEPIKSVGCRMPQSLYARMLQYKALNDSQMNRITLNDIIIEAVEKFMDENG